MLKHIGQTRSNLEPAMEAAVGRISRSGGTPLGVSEGDRFVGVIYLKDVVKRNVKAPLEPATTRPTPRGPIWGR